MPLIAMKWQKGHIEFTLSVYVCLFVYSRIVWPVTLSFMVGFKNNLAQMIMMIITFFNESGC